MPIGVLSWKVGNLIIGPLWHQLEMRGGYSNHTGFVGAAATWLGVAYLAWHHDRRATTFLLALATAVLGALAGVGLWFLFWLVIAATVGIPT